MIKICKYCEKEFTPSDCRNVYCSLSCANTAKWQDPKTIEKMRISCIEREKRNPQPKGKDNPRYKEPRKCIDCGKPFKGRDQKSIRCIDCICIIRIGENHPRWQGGKSFEPYLPNWTEKLREQIRERDSYTCQICDVKQVDKKHDVHHIDYDKKNCAEENLITLCHKCHTKTNSKRDEWTEYFKEKKLREAI